jgi:nitric oxide reductase large subunit
MHNYYAAPDGSDPAARLASHVLVGLMSSVIAGYIFVGLLGIRRNAPAYIIGSAGGESSGEGCVKLLG